MISDEISELQSLSREARQYWMKFQRKFPVRSSGLKLVNNNTIREWSYKGVTMASRPGSNGKRLEPVFRDSIQATRLPPTYRASPDFRNKRARTASRNYREPIHEISDMYMRPWTALKSEPGIPMEKPIHTPDVQVPHVFMGSNTSSEPLSSDRWDSCEAHFTKADSYFRLYTFGALIAC